MKITKKITLNLRKEKGNFIVSDTATLRMTTSVEGNIRFFNIEKKGTKWVVPIKTIKDRINQLEERRKILDERLHIMKQIVEDKK